MISQRSNVPGEDVCPVKQQREKVLFKTESTFFRSAVLILMLMLISFAGFAQQSSSSFADSLRLQYGKMALPFLFNGFEYVRYDTHIYRDGHPYFRVRDYGRGDIWYDGRYFPDRQLLFDAAREQVVIPADLKPGSYGQVALLPERVDSFSLQGLQFLHFRDSAQYRPGFYTRLHQGPKGTFYARYLKNFQKAVITNDGVWDVITDATYFEWETNGTFRVIHTQADLAKVLQVKTHLVKKYIRNQGLEFRKDHEAALLAAVRHFDPQ